MWAGSALRLWSQTALRVVAGDACSWSPSAATTFNMVANSGFPDGDSALYWLSQRVFTRSIAAHAGIKAQSAPSQVFWARFDGRTSQGRSACAHSAPAYSGLSPDANLRVGAAGSKRCIPGLAGHSQLNGFTASKAIARRIRLADNPGTSPQRRSDTAGQRVDGPRQATDRPECRSVPGLGSKGKTRRRSATGSR